MNEQAAPRPGRWRADRARHLGRAEQSAFGPLGGGDWRLGTAHSHVPYRAGRPPGAAGVLHAVPDRVSPQLDAARSTDGLGAARWGCSTVRPACPAAAVGRAAFRSASTSRSVAARSTRTRAQQLDLASAGWPGEPMATTTTRGLRQRPGTWRARRLCNERLLRSCRRRRRRRRCRRTRGTGAGRPMAAHRRPMTAAAGAVPRTRCVDMIDSWLWELANQIQQPHPRPGRLHRDAAQDVRLGPDDDPGPARARRRCRRRSPRPGSIGAGERGAATTPASLNDLFSYQKEIQFEGEVHNSCWSSQNFLDWTADGRRIVNDLMTGADAAVRAHRGDRTACAVRGVPPGRRGRRPAAPRAAELQDWIAGILNWHAQCGRYLEPELIRRYRSGAARPLAAVPGPVP